MMKFLSRLVWIKILVIRLKVHCLNSSVVYTASEISSMARRSSNKSFLSSFLSSFCTVKNFAPGFARKTGTAATFSITLVSNSSSEKFSRCASVIKATTTLATCFEGVIPHELVFMIRHKLSNSKGKHRLFELTPSDLGDFGSPLQLLIYQVTQGSKRPLYSRFLNEIVIVYKNFHCTTKMQRFIVKHCTSRSQIMCNVTVACFELIIYFILYNECGSKQIT